jgi:cytochrome c553
LPERSTASAIPASNLRAATLLSLLAATLPGLWPGEVAAADAQAGRAKAAACVVCHGAAGISTQPNAPHLAGQPAIYLEEQLKSYRSGERRHEQMTVVAKPLSDAEIANLAAWFSAIRIEATLPESQALPAK